MWLRLSRKDEQVIGTGNLLSTLSVNVGVTLFQVLTPHLVGLKPAKTNIHEYKVYIYLNKYITLY